LYNEFNKKNKNKFKRKYKNAVEQEYVDIYNKKLESIDDKSKVLLFKTLKTEYNLEFYLK
jgi:disulfide oxidoreductase YuzD